MASEDDRLKMLKLLLQSKEAASGATPHASLASPPLEILQRYESYMRMNKFQPGDLVQWKPGMRNRKKPGDSEVGVVVNVLSQALFPCTKREMDAGSPLFREPLDLGVGLLDSDGEFIICHFDSHRFQPAFNSSIGTSEGTRLQTLYLSLMKPSDPPLTQGDFVRWKPGLKNKKKPAEGEACVVLESLPEPLYDLQKSAGTPYFREPLTLKLGILDSDGEFLIFHYDGRRFERI